MQKSLHINADKCTGCLQCEMACSYENYGVFNPAKSRIKIFDFHARTLAPTIAITDDRANLRAASDPMKVIGLIGASALGKSRFVEDLIHEVHRGQPTGCRELDNTFSLDEKHRAREHD